MSFAILRYTNEDQLLLQGASRTRLTLGLLALAFVERDFATSFSLVPARQIQELLRNLFRIPSQINVKDLVMTIIVLSDYARCYEDAKNALTMMLENVNESYRLAEGILKSEISAEIKQHLDFRWRRRFLLSSLQMGNKYLIEPKHFFALDQPNNWPKKGPWSSVSYSRYEQTLASGVTRLDHTIDSMRFTRSFLSHFVPWFLKHAFTCDLQTMAYLRPKLTQRPGRALDVLGRALQTSVMIRVEFAERIHLGEALMDDLREHWKGFGGRNFSARELHLLLLGRDMPGAETSDGRCSRSTRLRGGLR
jgi:hypothetical protein